MNVVGTPVKGSTFGATLTVGITVPPGAKAVYVAAVIADGQSRTIDGVEFDGQPMTEIDQDNPSTDFQAAFFRYDNGGSDIGTGSANIVLTPSSSWRLHLQAIMVDDVGDTTGWTLAFASDDTDPRVTSDAYASDTDHLVVAIAMNSTDANTDIVADVGTDLGETSATGGGEQLCAAYDDGDLPTKTMGFSETTEQASGVLYQTGISIASVASAPVAPGGRGVLRGVRRGTRRGATMVLRNGVWRPRAAGRVISGRGC